ncbi:MAG: DUF4981 domain-containing protein [Selenomonadaceae bacterium]|nr:DUF4981 domain-containing protein [Selenomonadaceae bacterium]
MAFDLKKLADPEYFQENRLPAHSDHKYFADFNELASGQTKFARSLSGLWNFAFAPNLELIPKNFESEDFDCRAWSTIRVPAHIQMEGYGKPQYINTPYPWDGHEVIHQGEIPTRENPVACYVKYFNAPENWQKFFISFQGAESGIAVWLNGNFVGYSEDSFTPSDFELTPFIKQGENKLAVAVFRFTSGSWLEDQDFWRFSGLFRDVILYTKPEIHLEDIFVHAAPINNYTDGNLKIETKWNNDAEKIVELKIFDKDNSCVLEDSQKFGGAEKVFEFEIKNVALWSAEYPNLYRALFIVKNSAGEIVEVIPQNIGFREFKMDRNIMKINGKRIVFKGVNRHEFDCYNGRACNPADLEKDIVNLKKNNINALRTSHYPNPTRLYELCDIYGIYMIDEANVETHGSWMRNGGCYRDENTVPGDNPKWLAPLLDRAKSMVERDKNHPAILIWSCGNESCGGKNLFEMSEFYRKRDSSRLVHYESIFWDRRYNGTSDFESQMYTTVANIKKFLAEHRDKPFVCCEYSHSMGNSTGGISKYTKLTEEDELYQGGFIWDFADQAIMTDEGLKYGGDFGDRASDYNFSGNGIFFADHSPTTKLQEVKFCYQNFEILPSQNAVKIINKSLFTDVADFDLKLVLLRKGFEVWNKIIDAPKIAPAETGEIKIDLPNYGAGEYVLTASLCLKTENNFAPRGFEIAFGQTVFNVDAANSEISAWLNKKDSYQPVKPLDNFKKFRVVQSDVNLGVYGEGFSYMFSSSAATLTSIKYNGEEFISNFPVPNFWRAPIDNDYGNGQHMDSAQWKLASLYKKCVKIEYRADDKDFETVENYFGKKFNGEIWADTFEVKYTYELMTTPRSFCTVSYKVHECGSLQVAQDYKKVEGLAEFPDFSILFTLPKKYTQIKFYGLGPLDNYRDRLEGARLGIYDTNIFEEVEPYLLPQETGNHCGVRWFEVVDERGRGLKFFGGIFEASALPYSPHELENARHQEELPKHHNTFVKISAGQCGVGGDDSWGSPVLDEYKIKNEDKHFEFWVKGV